MKTKSNLFLYLFGKRPFVSRGFVGVLFSYSLFHNALSRGIVLVPYQSSEQPALVNITWYD